MFLHLFSVCFKGEFKVQKEAIWIVANFTSGGSANQVALGNVSLIVFVTNSSRSQARNIIIHELVAPFVFSESFGCKHIFPTIC